MTGWGDKCWQNRWRQPSWFVVVKTSSMVKGYWCTTPGHNQRDAQRYSTNRKVRCSKITSPEEGNLQQCRCKTKLTALTGNAKVITLTNQRRWKKWVVTGITRLSGAKAGEKNVGRISSSLKSNREHMGILIYSSNRVETVHICWKWKRKEHCA
jgi:hypothetical protein